MELPMAPVPKILLTAPFHHLESSLAERVRGLGGGDPLARRRVVVISNRLRDHVQGLLARAGGFAGVSVLSMIDLARETAEPERSLAGYTRPHPVIAEVLMEEAFESARGEFAFFGPDTRGYGGNLYATFTDLAEANLTPEALMELSRVIPGPDAARLRDLALLAGRFGSSMRERGFYDRSSLFLTACERAEAEPPRVPTIFYGFAEMNALQRRLAAAVCRETQTQALVPAQAGAPACAHARPLIRWFEEQGFRREQAEPLAPRPLSGVADALFSRDGSQAGPLAADALRVVAAPARGREVREACREMLRAREDLGSDDEICVLMSERGGYQDLFEETFQALEIPCRTEDGNPLSEALVARLFLLLLRLRMNGYPRADLMRYLVEGGFTGTKMFRELAHTCDFEELADDPVLASKWEFFSRSLPYARDLDAWLSAFSSGLDKLDEEDEEFPTAYSFIMSMLVVFNFLDRIPEQGLPSLFVERALWVFWETTSGLTRRKELEEVLSLLEEFDEITGEMTQDAFCELCVRFLEKTPLRGGEPERGHLASLSSIQSARGLSFDAVVLAGMGEGLFPPQGSEDPLLPDSAREALNRAAKERFPEREAGLPLKRSRESEARFQLWTVLHSARKRFILTATSAEGGAGNEAASFPSMFLHYLADALGEAGDGAWGLFAEERSRTAVAALDAGAISRSPVHLREFDLALMAEQIGLVNRTGRPEAGRLACMNDFPGFLRRRAALDKRWRKALTAYDGMLTAPDLREVIRERVHSPGWPLGVTSLEKFFGCPYRFVNDRLHPRMEKRVEPLPLFDLDGKSRGQLTHRILELFHDSLMMRDRLPHAPDGFTAQDTLGYAVYEAMREAKDKAVSPPLPALLWEALEGALYRRLLGYLELVDSDGSGRRPVSVEERFGGRRSEPLRISLEAGELFLNGRMDLLERNEAGEYRVVDFKTVGRRSSIPSKGKILDGGESLQLHLYARHLRARADALPEGARVSGAYVYITEEEGVIERARSCEDIEGRMADVDALLNFYLASAVEGRFFPTPSEQGCKHCDYKLLCGPDRAERAARKEGAPAVSELLALKERAE